MASIATDQAPVATGPKPIPRRFKASELPLTSATRSVIEGLAHSFKKKGGYDKIRKQVWEKFEASDYQAQVTKSIVAVAEQEVERNPSQLLTLERRKAATLIDGALDRSGVYQEAEAVIDQLIDLTAIETRIRELRKAEIGEQAAAEEQLRGSKTDQDYANDTARRLEDRERIRRDLREKEEQIEEEKRKIEREERKRLERELEKAEARRKEEREVRRLEREAKDAEREKARQKERDERRAAREEREKLERDRASRRRSRDREHERSPEPSRQPGKERERDRVRAHSRSHRRESKERRRLDHSPTKDRDRHRVRVRPEEAKQQLSKEELDRLEQDALADLLRESKKATEKPAEMEIDEALAPPPKRTKLASAIQPIRRDPPRNIDSKAFAPEFAKSDGKDSARGSLASLAPLKASAKTQGSHETRETREIEAKEATFKAGGREEREFLPPKGPRGDRHARGDNDFIHAKEAKSGDSRHRDSHRDSMLESSHYQFRHNTIDDARGTRDRAKDRSRSRIRRDQSRSRPRVDRAERLEHTPDAMDRYQPRPRGHSRSRDKTRRQSQSRSRARTDCRDRSRSPLARSDRRDTSRSRLRSDAAKRTRSRDRERDEFKDRSRATRHQDNERDRDRDRDRDRNRDRDRHRDRHRDPDRSHRSPSRRLTMSGRDSKQQLNDAEAWKQSEIKKREQEAKAYLAAQREARQKGLPIPGLDDRHSLGDRTPEVKRTRLVPEDIDSYRPGKRDREADRERNDRAERDKYRMRDRDGRDHRDRGSHERHGRDSRGHREGNRDDRRDRRRSRSRSRSRSRRRERDRSTGRDGRSHGKDRERDRERKTRRDHSVESGRGNRGRSRSRTPQGV